MNEQNKLLVGGAASWIYSWIGPATDIIQFATAVAGFVAIILSIYISAKKIYDSVNSKKDN